MSACNAILLALLARDRFTAASMSRSLIDIAVAMTGTAWPIDQWGDPGVSETRRTGLPPSASIRPDGPLYMACANDRLYRCLVTEVLGTAHLVTDPEFATRKARTANGKLRAAIAGVFASDRLGELMAKMKRPTYPSAIFAPRGSTP
jgi:crotonobetainyl-CoA:carnitine CoA-transferase CaiB-like acyl-CoA transferase